MLSSPSNPSSLHHVLKHASNIRMHACEPATAPTLPALQTTRLPPTLLVPHPTIGGSGGCGPVPPSWIKIGLLLMDAHHFRDAPLCPNNQLPSTYGLHVLVDKVHHDVRVHHNACAKEFGLGGSSSAGPSTVVPSSPSPKYQ